jgi:predicted nucleic acid-binding protein
VVERQLSFIDTDVLVYAYDRSETRKQRVARAQLERLWRERGGALSTQVLQEFWDALIVEAARRVGATRLLAEDLQPGRRIGGISIENPFLA